MIRWLWLLLLTGLASIAHGQAPLPQMETEEILREVVARGEAHEHELAKNDELWKKRFRAMNKQYPKAARKGWDPQLFEGERVALLEFKGLLNTERRLLRNIGYAEKYGLSHLARNEPQSLGLARTSIRQREKLEGQRSEARKRWAALDLSGIPPELVQRQRQAEALAFRLALETWQRIEETRLFVNAALGGTSPEEALAMAEAANRQEQVRRRAAAVRREQAKENLATLVVTLGAAVLAAEILDDTDKSPERKQEEIGRINDIERNSCIARGGQFVEPTDSAIGTCVLP